MAGVNSLGIGSGVLTSDLIDKLRAADDAIIIKPLENKITVANQKEDAYSLLSTLMTTFKSSASNLGGEDMYLGRAVSGNTDAVTVKAEAGSDVQSFNITNVSKAQKDVWNSQSSFESASTAIPTLGSGTLTVTIGGSPLTIDYTAATTLDDIKAAINENAGTTMTASSMQVGDASYSLAISSDELNQAITFSDSNGGVDGLSTLLNLTNIQPAKAATFDFNGIAITRSTNEIGDLVNGVVITLNQDQAATDSASVNVTQNSTLISSEMSIFVQNFNNLNTNLQDMTNSDKTSGSVGIFNGESFIKSISRDMTDLIFKQNNSAGNSLVDYGISIDRQGVMSLDAAAFETAYAKDPAAAQLFFSGDSTTDGLFKELDAKINGYTGYKKLMSNFSDQLSSSKSSLTDQYDRQKAALDNRYEIMSKRFAAYDAIISKMNASFSSLQLIINTSQASTN
jgi:flagellar hook-associated protein 2